MKQVPTWCSRLVVASLAPIGWQASASTTITGMLQPHPKANRRGQAHGFTLIELLTVISILAILAALLFPVFSIVRKRGQRTLCSSNLRQLHIAVSLYVQDYDGMYPNTVNPADAVHPERWTEFPDFMAIVPQLPQFHQVLVPYTKSGEIFRCPSDIGLQVSEPFPGWLLNATPSSYNTFGTSYFYHTELAQQRANDASITNPVGTWVLMDAAGLWHGSQSELGLADLLRYNILFADGHVRNITHEALAKAWNTIDGNG